MSGKRYGIILFAALLLMVLFYSTERGYENSAPAPRTQLLSGIALNSIRSLTLTKGTDTAVVELGERGWVVPARGSFRADEKRIRSLLFRLSDLQVSQLVTDSPDKFDPLGVSDKAVAEGKTKITLKDQAGGELVSLFVGAHRKTPGSTALGAQSGQYVRRADQNQVYAVLEAPLAPSDIASWIDQVLLNISQVKVRRVEQATLTGSGTELRFALLPGGGEERKFQIDGGLQPGEELQDSLVTKLLSGIENLRITDVVPAGEVEAKVAGLQFDTRTSYSVSNGLIYSIDSAKVGEDFYLKVAIRFEPTLAEAMKKEVEERNSEIERLRAEELKKPESERQQVRDPILLELSNEKESEKLTGELSRWIYKVAQFQGERYRMTRAEITRPLAEAKAK